MQGMPQVTDEHRRLVRLAGRWSGAEKLSPSPWGSGGPATGHFDMRVGVDGFFLIQDYSEEKEGRVVYRAHGIIGWDPEQKNYSWYWVDSLGMVPGAPSRGHWEGDTLTMEHPAKGAQRGRYVFRFYGADEIGFSIHNSRDGGATWVTFMEGRYRRD